MTEITAQEALRAALNALKKSVEDDTNKIRWVAADSIRRQFLIPDEIQIQPGKLVKVDPKMDLTDGSTRTEIIVGDMPMIATYKNNAWVLSISTSRMNFYQKLVSTFRWVTPSDLRSGILNIRNRSSLSNATTVRDIDTVDWIGVCKEWDQIEMNFWNDLIRSVYQMPEPVPIQSEPYGYRRLVNRSYDQGDGGRYWVERKRIWISGIPLVLVTPVSSNPPPELFLESGSGQFLVVADGRKKFTTSKELTLFLISAISKAESDYDPVDRCGW